MLRGGAAALVSAVGAGGLSKEVGSVAGTVNLDRVVPKVDRIEPPAIINGIKRMGTSPASVVVVNTTQSNRPMFQNPRVLPAATPQNSTLGSITAKFVDGEFSQSCKCLSAYFTKTMTMKLVP